MASLPNAGLPFAAFVPVGLVEEVGEIGATDGRAAIKEVRVSAWSSIVSYVPCCNGVYASPVSMELLMVPKDYNLVEDM